MAGLFTKCDKCGETFEVDPQMVANAHDLGDALDFAHDCDTPDPEPPPLRRFRVQLLMIELPPPGDEAYEALGVDEAKVNDHIRFRDPDLGGISLDLIAGLGETVEAANFPEAVNGPFTVWLEQAWQAMKENAAVAEIPVRTG